MLGVEVEVEVEAPKAVADRSSLESCDRAKSFAFARGGRFPREPGGDPQTGEDISYFALRDRLPFHAVSSV